MSAVQEIMDKEAFAAAYAAGTEMTIEQAIALSS
jgi:hypothetical protein